MHILKPRKDRGGYLQINLYQGNVGKTEKVHRLVAFAFIPKIDGKDHIDHINGNRSDNKSTNLRWCTLAENKGNPQVVINGNSHKLLWITLLKIW